MGNLTNDTNDKGLEEIVQLTGKILYLLIAIFTILGNTLVLVATWKERSLHQPNKYFIAYLAVADLLAGLFIAPLTFYGMYAKESRNSVHLCRFMVWIDTFALTTSIYTLTFISFDRYLKISKPLQYKSRMSTSISLKIVFIIVLLSTFLATYSAIPHSGSGGILFSGMGDCSDADPNTIREFYTFLTITAFFLPAIAILTMYALIFLVAHKRQKMLRNGELGQSLNNQNQHTVFHQDMKLIRMLMLVIGAFIFCWGPWFILLLLYFSYPKLINWTNSSTMIITFVANILPLFNSLCNPIIYAWLDQTYREAFKRLFRRMMCREYNTDQQPDTRIPLTRQSSH
ncbi:octopamine receptor Oamb-like [Dendronephthya gigantea]|uniref:octopamine receptor Oamb-like n=1 Tax=Dendronephthya gigantea TaxID=151771 RepID=UPI00106C1B7D|nr:octopamine receptor Oamb-like [Dendronephthya gigantea]